MSVHLHHAILAGVLAAGAAGIVHLFSSGAWFVVGVVVGAMFLVIGLPLLGIRAFSQLLSWRKAALWQSHEGRHYSFGGVSLDIEDDGRTLWLAAADLQRALRSHDKDDVVAARHAGRWRRDPRGRLQLRVDAVVQVLAHTPKRMDPHVIHLRRYLEREVLFPAEKRRTRKV